MSLAEAGKMEIEAETMADADHASAPAGDAERGDAAAAGDIGPRARPPAPPVAPARFEDVYRADFRRMVRVAHLLTGDNGVAEEIVQDAFVGLYRRFDTVADPQGYLYRSVVNGCRSRHRRRPVVERLRRLRVVTEVGPPEIDETWRALETLTSRRRAVVVLRFYADLPEAEIAELLGCSTGTVKSLLHRALAQLRGVVNR